MTLYSYFQEKRQELFDYCLSKHNRLGLYFCHYMLGYQVTINDFERFNTPSFIHSITFKILSWLNPKAAASFYSNELSVQYDKLRQGEWDASLVEKRDDAPKEENRARQVIENDDSDVNALFSSYHQLILGREKEFQKVDTEKEMLLQAKLNHELKMTSLINEEKEDRKEIEAIALALEEEQLPTKVIDIMRLWQQGFNQVIKNMENGYSERKFLDLIAEGDTPSLLNFTNSKLFDGQDADKRWMNRSLDFKNFVEDFFKLGLVCILEETTPAKEIMNAKLLLRLNKQDRSLKLTPYVRNGLFGNSCESNLERLARLNPKLYEQYKDASQKMEEALGGKHYVLKYGVQVYSELLKQVLTYVKKALEITKEEIRLNQQENGTRYALTGSIGEWNVPKYKIIQKKIEAALTEHQTYKPAQVEKLNLWLDKMVSEKLKKDREYYESWQMAVSRSVT